jgi:5-hydroxyisourate hydrolase-like protein (transthyretin family)
MRLPILLLLLFQVAAQAPAPSQTKAEKASIAGIVLRSDSGEPLARAEVKLTRVPDEEGAGHIVYEGEESDGLSAVQTGNDGKFLLKDLDPGRYRLTVSRNGYAQQTYGSKNASGPGAIINLAAADKKTDVVFRLQAAGVITGRVRDASGDPVAGYLVSLLKASFNGERQSLSQDPAR